MISLPLFKLSFYVAFDKVAEWLRYNKAIDKKMIQFGGVIVCFTSPQCCLQLQKFSLNQTDFVKKFSVKICFETSELSPIPMKS